MGPALGDAQVATSEGIVATVVAFTTALSTYGIAKFTRSGTKEANQTAGWTSLVTALQKEVGDLRQEEDQTQERIKKVAQDNQDLSRRVYVLERSRHRWKWWGQRVVEIMNERGITFPDPPEPLHDTDPNLIDRSNP